jgi:hypothetical protein|tara:strand:- start:61 stop:495 length:435 start_codon:yes stop_codon:yes gene_type:complete
MSIYTASKEDIKPFGYFRVEAPSREELEKEAGGVCSHNPFQHLAAEAARLHNTGRPQTEEHIRRRTEGKRRSVVVNGIEYASQKNAAINNNVMPSVISELIKEQGRNITLERGHINCPHCDKIGTNHRSMRRWHYDNCKKKRRI